MSKFSEKAIEEANRQRELKMDIDYSCVQFGKWLNSHAHPIYIVNKWTFIRDKQKDKKSHTTEELYQLYKNTLDNNK